ncbi:MAG: magnesium/cobalt transporter CorA [Bacteroidia bacterium]|nr:magnesium/cobalt transporter CorA [Bacteroidia bacterium]
MNSTVLSTETTAIANENKAEKVKITLVEFNETEYDEQVFTDINECVKHTKKNTIKWINIDGIRDIDMIERIGKLFTIHPLTLEDILNTIQRPKFEDYEHYVVAIMKMLYYNNGLQSEQLSILLFENNTVISFQEEHKCNVLDTIRTNIRQGKGRIRKFGADYLAYSLIDAVVDCYFGVLEKIDDDIELLEEELVGDPDKQTLTRLHHMKRQMIFLRKAVWPLRELINNIERSETKLIKQSTTIYLRDVLDHTIRIIDTVESFRDLLSSMMDVYLSSTNNKMNEVMKVLTIITTLFVPLTFIVGVYGMNFDYMPELHSHWGYFGVWGVMIIIFIVLLIYFKRRKWL